MDSCVPHDADIKNFFERIGILSHSYNCTSIHQPLEMGFIAALKKRYRYYMLCKTMVDLESRNERRDNKATVPAEMCGLSECYDPQMLDVTTIVKHSWHQVSKYTIVLCWVKAKALPDVINVDLNAEFGSMCGDLSSPKMHETVEKRQKTFLNVKRSDSLNEKTTDSIIAADVSKMLTLETDEIVLSGQVEGAINAQTSAINTI